MIPLLVDPIGRTEKEKKNIKIEYVKISFVVRMNFFLYGRVKNPVYK